MARLLLLVVLLAGSGCALTPPTPDSKRVDDFELEGEKALEEADIKEKVLTGESSWLPWWVPVFGHAEWFDPLSWQADLRRIQRFYEANGYYQARVVEDVVTETSPGHVRLLVKVQEGAPARIASLDLRGLDPLPEDLRRKVTESLPLRPGQVFLEESWGRTKSLLASRLRELGYAEAMVSGEALVDADAAAVEVGLDVEPGRRYRFGKTFVATDPGAQVPARLVADVASPVVRPGTFFSESALLQAQARVFQMGVFGGVKVNRGAPDREAGTVPVVIDVREAPFRSMRLGFGLGGDLIRQELRLVGEYTHRNLGLSRLVIKNARLDKLTVKGKLGWAFLPTVFAVATGDPTAKTGPTARVLTQYEVPRLFEIRELAFQGGLDLSRTLDNAFDYFGGDLKLALVWRPLIDVSVVPSLNVSTYLLNTAVKVSTTAPSAAIGCPTAPAACVVGYLDATVEWDRRDNKLEPREGFYVGLSAAAGLSQTTALTPFARIVPEARGYLSLGRERRVTLAGKLRLGTLLAPGNQAPIVVRFFSGGSSMRGFNQRRLSPLVAVPTLVETVLPDGKVQSLPNYDDGETLPIGGSGLLEASFEVRWNAWEDLVLAVFNDWGLVTAEPLGVGTDWSRSLYAAVGLGVRYRTPLGPIRFDLGFRLPFVGGPQEVDLGEARQFRSFPGCFFGLGSKEAFPSISASALPYAGSPDNTCSFHLSIGEAF